MRLAFHYRQPFQKQIMLLNAITDGASAHGDEVVGVCGFDGVEEDCDGLILFGIGGISKEIHDEYELAGKKIVFVDKGYTRRNYLRVAVNSFQPDLARVPGFSARWEKLGIELAPYSVREDGAILLDGASNKFCQWKALGDWPAWGTLMVGKIRAHTDRKIVYRPRPSHNNESIKPVAEAELSLGPLAADFARARLVVSYGGNIGFDAVVAGIPHFAIGDSIARPLSQTKWESIGELVVPSNEERYDWCCRVAYCQWTYDEFRSGEAWSYIKKELL